MNNIYKKFRDEIIRFGDAAGLTIGFWKNQDPDGEKYKVKVGDPNVSSAACKIYEAFFRRDIDSIDYAYKMHKLKSQIADDFLAIKLSPVPPKNIFSSRIIEGKCVPYCEADVKNTINLYKGTLNMAYGKHAFIGQYIPGIKDVMFENPATIVFWEDGTKTVVKAQRDDPFDPEKGLAMAISRKALGNRRDYYNVFKRWERKTGRRMDGRYKGLSEEGENNAAE